MSAPGPPRGPARRVGVVVTLAVSLLAGIGLGVGLHLGVLPPLALTAPYVGPPLDLHAVDWGDATLPGSVCRSPGPIALHGGDAVSVPSSFDGPEPDYPQDVHVDTGDLVYGDLTGDGRDDAAVPLRCNNHESTSAGTTVVTVLLFNGSSGAAVLLGALPSSQPRLGEIPNTMAVHRLEPGRVEGDESFYGPADANCCPSGRAVTTWPWTGSTLGTPSTLVLRPIAS